MFKPSKNIKVILVIIACISITLLLVLRLSIHKPNTIKNDINYVRQRTKPVFDSLAQKISKEDNFEERLSILIENNESSHALILIDSAININPKNELLHVYKGMAFFVQKDYKAAIEEYNTSINLNHTEFPLALIKRAEAFMKLKKYDYALNDYKKASSINPYYYYHLSNAFNVLKLKDSSTKYYNIFKKLNPTVKEGDKKIVFTLN